MQIQVHPNQHPDSASCESRFLPSVVLCPCSLNVLCVTLICVASLCLALCRGRLRCFGRPLVYFFLFFAFPCFSFAFLCSTAVRCDAVRCEGPLRCGAVRCDAARYVISIYVPVYLCGFFRIVFIHRLAAAPTKWHRCDTLMTSSIGLYSQIFNFISAFSL